jgi:hypothetical protein
MLHDATPGRLRLIVSPAVQWPAEPLKSEISKTRVPIPNELALLLSAAVALGDGTTIVTNEAGRAVGPWAIERAVRDARGRIPGPMATCGRTRRRHHARPSRRRSPRTNLPGYRPHPVIGDRPQPCRAGQAVA